MALHELPLDASVLHGYFSRELEPVLTVEPGDSVRFSTPNAGWSVGREGKFASRDPERDTGHALAGPIEVRGARPGQVLAVTVDEVVPGSWGVTFGEDARLDWELEGDVGRAAGKIGRARSVPRRARDAAGRAGSPLDDPAPAVRREHRLQGGALFSAGDGHAAQGDGEVSGTAIEALALASVVADLRVTQVVNQSLGVHAVLRDDVFV